MRKLGKQKGTKKKRIWNLHVLLHNFALTLHQKILNRKTSRQIHSLLKRQLSRAKHNNRSTFQLRCQNQKQQGKHKIWILLLFHVILPTLLIKIKNAGEQTHSFSAYWKTSRGVFFFFFVRNKHIHCPKLSTEKD